MLYTLCVMLFTKQVNIDLSFLFLFNRFVRFFKTLQQATPMQTNSREMSTINTKKGLKRKSECSDMKASSTPSDDFKCHSSTSKYFVNKHSNDNIRLGRNFFTKPCVALAKELLGKKLVRVLDSGERLSGRIVETEAYCGEEDTACHSYKGKKTGRNKAMFMESGTSYVYMIYGMYHCLNISSEGEGTAVLIRALEPLEGLSEMHTHRQRRRKETSKPLKPHQLCNGPGKLADALCITKTLDQVDLVISTSMWIERDQVNEDTEGDVMREDTDAAVQNMEEGGLADIKKVKIISCPRIGIDSTEETWRLKPLRFYLCGNKCVSVKNKEAETATQL
ncbi:putative 3-methyladenine DNA glycosylase [Antedon mediterranea]|uniref:putative 3-methyladenine DNA glycosylase n=1 Tax=Antedon mediterranea TaxID=105859 RepID=UPI003AF4C975